MSAPAAAPEAEGPSLTQELTRFGIRHEPSSGQRRYLFTNDGCIGLSDVMEGWALIQLLDRIQGDLAEADRNQRAYELLSDLNQMESEKRAIGGGPNWQEREAAIWARVAELFEP